MSSSFSGLIKLAQYLSSFRVYGFERKFWPKFGQNASFLAKFSVVQKWIWLSFNFGVFFEFGFWQSLVSGFFGFRFGKIAKTRSSSTLNRLEYPQVVAMNWNYCSEWATLKWNIAKGSAIGFFLPSSNSNIDKGLPSFFFNSSFIWIRKPVWRNEDLV